MVFTANHLTDTGNKIVQEIYKLNTTQKSTQHKIQQNKTTLVQSTHTTLGQETRPAYSITLLSPYGAKEFHSYV